VRNRGVITMFAAAVAAIAIVAVFSYRNDEKPVLEKRRVVAIFKTVPDANAFWTAIRDGVESGAQDYGLEVSIRSPRDEKYVDEQIGIVENAIRHESPAAIVLAACDYQRLVGPVQEAKTAGIKVVCIDSFIATDDADAKIGTDNVEVGQKCGAALLKNLRAPPGGGKPRVAVLSYVQGSSTAIDRETGLRKALGDRVIAIGTSYSDAEAERAYVQTKEVLAAEPELGGIAALNLPTLLGAAKALAESGRKKSVVLVGVDNSTEVMKYIEQGVIRDTIVQKPFNMGYLSMATVRELIDGKRPRPYANTGSVDIDKANMFEAENQKLLFPAPGE
jgi:ribose transport system substrate-binding protein